MVDVQTLHVERAAQTRLSRVVDSALIKIPLRPLRYECGCCKSFATMVHLPHEPNIRYCTCIMIY
jgi:hypothetical protein